MSEAYVLAPGDRVPNFVLPDGAGTRLMFYNKTQGGPAILLACDLGDRAAAAELAALAESLPALAAEAVEVFVIARGRGAVPAALEAAPRVLVLRDLAGKIGPGLAAAALGRSGVAACALVLDPNQRLIAALAPDAAPLAGRVLAALRRRPQPSPLTIGLAAPVLVIPDLLDAAACAELIEVWRTAGHAEGDVFAVKDGKPVREVDFSRKKRLDHTIRDEALHERLLKTIVPRIGDEVFKAFAFEGFALERLVIGAYDESRGDYFRAHRDNLNPNTAGRRFAVSLNLNDDYEGGELMFPEYGRHLYRAAAGTGVVFSCALIHEARPVRRGRRFVLLGFLRDPHNRPHPWSVRLG